MIYNFRTKMTYQPSMNYIHHLNGTTQISRITVYNDAAETVRNVKLRVSSNPDFLEEMYFNIVEIPAGGSIDLKPDHILINGDLLLSYNEDCEGVYILEILTADENSTPLHKDTYAVKILPYDMWTGHNRPELIASFVTPNDRRVQEILAKAGDRIGAAFAGYDDMDVLEYMKIIFEVIQDERITYVYPPANWDLGQRVRMPGFTLANKVGCCIDMAVLYAACLEAASLHPLIMILHGHAIAGCWLKPKSFSDVLVSDGESVHNLQRLHELQMVECTLMDNYAFGSTFEYACEATDKHFDSFEYVVDVRRARAGGIMPVPLKEIHDRFGVEPEVEADTVPEDEIFYDPQDMGLLEDLPEEDMSKQDYWEKMLLNLSLRNPLINMPMGRSYMPIMADMNMITYLTRQLKNGARIRLIPAPEEAGNLPDAKDLAAQAEIIRQMPGIVSNDLDNGRLRFMLPPEETLSRLKHIYHAAKTFREESGSSVLYMAVGLLKWKVPGEDKDRLAPLMLVPVDFERKTANTDYDMVLRDEEWLMNTTLFEKLREDFGIQISGVSSVPMEDDLPAYRKLFNTVLQAIITRPGWTVLERACIGTFSYGEYMLWKDMHDHRDAFSKHPFVQSLINGKLSWSPSEDFMTAESLDHQVKAREVLMPISADASQLSAVKAALDGRSFVMHGPPGTGKSQTISNMIANAIYQGKSVLFVAKKLPALEVVRERLDNIGLGPFCLQLHGSKANRQYILSQMQETLALEKDAKDPLYEHTGTQIDALSKKLRALSENLNKPQRCGLSLYELMGMMTRYQNASDAVDFDALSASLVTREELSGMCRQMKLLEEITKSLPAIPDHPLRDFNRTHFNLEERKQLTDLTKQWLSGMNALSEEAASVCREIGLGDAQHPDLRTCVQLADLARYCVSRPVLMARSMAQGNTFRDLVETHQRLEKLLKVKTEFDEDYKKVIPEKELGDLIALSKRIEGKNGLLAKVSRDTVIGELRNASRHPESIKAETMMDELFRMQDYYDKCRTMGTDTPLGRWMVENASDIDWTRWLKVEQRIQEVTGEFDKLDLSEDVHQQMHAYVDRVAMAETGSGPVPDKALFEKTVADYEKLRSCTSDLVKLTGYECGRPSDLLRTPDFARTLQTWQAHYHELEAWCSYCEQREEARRMGLSPVVDAIDKGLAPEEILPAFYKSWSGAYVSKLISSNALLQNFSGFSFENTVRKYQELCRDFEQLSRREIRTKLSSRIPSRSVGSDHEDLTMMNRAAMGAGAKLTIRQLFNEMPEAVRLLKPCMMMSPSSVAQYIDPDFPKFDLVIIDEASQMTTSESVGAIARGKQVIIAGDEQQLPPTAFFRKQRDLSSLELEDLESVLDDALALNMPECYLNWHYRSAHESLITFSNRHYYGGRLNTFPSIDADARAVKYQRVNGIYDRAGTRTNRIEAEAVTAEMVRRVRKDPETSLGVITFNIQQRALIEDLWAKQLESDTALAEAVLAAEREVPVFIKNLESVQGDERDVILFSLGFGPDEVGVFSMNFGPVNKKGGHRRLNVAVTRARKEMVVFASFDPAAVKVRDTSPQGVKDLKDFLEYASGSLAARAGEDAPENDERLQRSRRIADALAGLGYQTDTDIGCSAFRIDVGIRDPRQPQKYLLAVIFDDDVHALSDTVRDRLVLQKQVLARMGWEIQNLWLLDWWQDEDTQIRKIDDKMKKLQAI